MPIRLSGINSGLDTDAIVKELVSAYSLKTEKYEKQKTTLEWKQDAWKSLNTKIYGFYTNVSNMRYSSAYSLKKATVSNPAKATVTADTDSVTGTQTLNILQMSQASYLTGGYIGEDVTAASTLKDLGYEGGPATIKLKKPGMKEGEEIKIQIGAETKVSEILEKFGEAGLNANLDTANGRIFLSAKESGAAANFDLIADDANSEEALRALGFIPETNRAEEIDRLQDEVDAYTALKAQYDDANTPTDEKIAIKKQLEAYSQDVKNIAADRATVEDVVRKRLATKIDGQDAIITLNGVEYTSTTNLFKINGLSIEATGVTGPEKENAITINTSTDTQGIYDTIKDFLTEYNTLINEITKLYNAESAKDYEPLTDEEREAMSDEQIEKWEGKIKSALLRRDNTLGGIMNAMTNAMSQSYEVDGKKFSLSSFGISTLGFLNAAENEQNAYHIDGDEDDENTSGKKDKLMAAIQENPNEIMEFMKQLTSNLYTSIDEKMKSTALSSAYKVYNDKELDREMTDIEKLIAKWEDKIAEQEDSYFKKFSQMEAALSKLQSQTNALGGLLGQ